jgi:excisionase family DNA binding protein
MDTDVKTRAFLHVHGLDVEPKGLNAQLRATIQALQSLYFPEPGCEGLTAPEAAVLRSGGLDPAPRSFGEKGDPLLQGALTHAGLLETGLTTLQAAKVLRVSDARIRQRLQDRTLLAIKTGRSWKLPLFQFADGQELPGWGEVARKLPRDIAPVAVERWLMLPNPDLVTGADEAPVSPRAWLREGRPAKAVAALAAGLS